MGEREISNWMFRVFFRTSELFRRGNSQMGWGGSHQFLRAQDKTPDSKAHFKFQIFALVHLGIDGEIALRRPPTETKDGAEYQKTRSTDGLRGLMVGPWVPYTIELAR